MFKSIYMAPIIALALNFAALPVRAQDAGALDGNWEGAMTMIHGAGIGEKDYPPQTWRLSIQGNAAHMFIRTDDGKFSEIKPGGFKMVRNQNNALIYAMDAGADADGPWIETESWEILKKSPDTLGVTFSGAVNNPNSRDPAIVEFFTIRTGVFKLAK